jgi:hypothetical protein
MALRCLESHAAWGRTVVVVGEWRGLTATPAFEDALGRSHRLVERIPLPNWGNSVAEMTVWQMRAAGSDETIDGAGNAKPKTANDSCDRASPLLCARCGRRGGTLWRCRWCRDRCYCGPSCAKADEAAHAASHALRFVMLPPGAPKLMKRLK